MGQRAAALFPSGAKNPISCMLNAASGSEGCLIDCRRAVGPLMALRLQSIAVGNIYIIRKYLFLDV